MNKKATEMLEIWITNLVLVVMIFLILLALIPKISDNAAHTARVNARDFGLSYDISALAQGNLLVVYNISSPKYSLDLKNDCTVFVTDVKKNIPYDYTCNAKQQDTVLVLKDDIYSIRKNE